MDMNSVATTRGGIGQMFVSKVSCSFNGREVADKSFTRIWEESFSESAILETPSCYEREGSSH